MVDVSGKPVTARRAVAEATVTMSPETLSLVIDGGGSEGRRPRRGRAGRRHGRQADQRADPALPSAAADRPAGLDHARTGRRASLRIRAEAATTGQTGVEMEAMTAASVAALTVYDMVKGVERGVEIGGVRLVSKSGGKSGDWVRQDRRRVDPPRGRRPGARAAGRIGEAVEVGRSVRQPGRPAMRRAARRSRPATASAPACARTPPGRRRRAARRRSASTVERAVAARRARGADRGPARVGAAATTWSSRPAAPA